MIDHWTTSGIVDLTSHHATSFLHAGALQHDDAPHTAFLGPPDEPSTAYCCRSKFGSCYETQCPEGMHVCRNCRGLRVVNYPRQGSMAADEIGVTNYNGTWFLSTLKEHYKPWLGLSFLYGPETNGGITFEQGKVRRWSQLVAIKPPGGKWESNIEQFAARLPLPAPTPGAWPPIPRYIPPETRLLDYFNKTAGYSFAFRPPDAGMKCANSWFQCLTHGRNPLAAAPGPDGCLLATTCRPGEFCCCTGKAEFEPCSATKEDVPSWDKAKNDVCRSEIECMKKHNSQQCLRRSFDMTGYYFANAEKTGLKHM
eukprot:GEMP01027395.1.p1 GENE.GEMP01027395.1~~GEMP01027395.1.p1  ORF type:complete len:311 (+),score=63.80 GEMP01027395.1:123-1055(+)